MVLVHWYKQGKRKKRSLLPSAPSLQCPFCRWKILCSPWLPRVGSRVKYVLSGLFALHSSASSPEGQPHHPACYSNWIPNLGFFQESLGILLLTFHFRVAFFFLTDCVGTLKSWCWYFHETVALGLSILLPFSERCQLFWQILWFWCLVFNIGHILTRHYLLYVWDISSLISVIGSFQWYLSYFWLFSSNF